MAPRGCGTERFASMQASGFSKDEVVAVVLAFPEVRAVLALMNGGIELRDRQHLVAAYETADVTEAGEMEKTSSTLPGAKWRFSHSKTNSGACRRRIRSAPLSRPNSAPSTSILRSVTLSLSLKYSSSATTGTVSVVRFSASIGPFISDAPGWWSVGT
jgi:hypothetical protein